uniref:Uncharacterized protein n=1 Tax=Panagrolaimus sp. JU765 TaxID=591449 RepID=A0AC34QC62_9BILA
MNIKDCSSNVRLIVLEYFGFDLNIDCQNSYPVQGTTAAAAGQVTYSYVTCQNYDQQPNCPGSVTTGQVRCARELVVNGQSTGAGGAQFENCNYGTRCVAGRFYDFKNDRMMSAKGCANSVQAEIQSYLGQSLGLYCQGQSPVQQLTGSFRYAYVCCSSYDQQPTCVAPNANLYNNAKMPILSPIAFLFPLFIFKFVNF